MIHNSDDPDSPSPDKTVDPEVEIVKSQYVEPGRPTALAQCTAKEEFAQSRRSKQDITDYSHLSIGDIVSGYLNQVHSSRDLEIDMVKQIQHKSEVKLSFHSESYLLYQPPSLLLMTEYAVDLVIY